MGKPIVYAGESSALAMLEVLARLETERPPIDYQLVRIECDDAIGMLEYSDSVPPLVEKSREWGDEWLAEGKYPLARVPSAIAPFCSNILVNPAHPEARGLTVTAASRYPWDMRLFS